MPARATPFETRIRMLLVLLVLLLAGANVGNFLLLRAARAGLRSVQGRLASEIARRALREGGEVPMTAALANPGSVAMAFPPESLDSLAGREGLLGVEIVGFDGTVLSSSRPGRLGARDEHLAIAGPAGLDGLRAGEEFRAGPVTHAGQPAMILYLPVGAGRRPARGMFKVLVAAPELARADRAYRIFAAAQAAALLLAVLAALLISRWIARPFNQLAQAVVGAPGAPRPWAASTGDPDALVASFRQVLETLAAQEEELRSLSSRAGPAGAVQSADPVAEFARTIAPGMASGALVADREGRLVAFNHAAARILGTQPGEVIGGPVAAVLAGSPDLMELVRATLRDGRARTREVVAFRTPAGGTGHLGAALSPIAAEGRWTGGLLCLFSELSEIGSLREQARLRESLAAVGRLSAGIAHEVRNALAAILGYARLVERAAGASPAAEHGREIAKEVESLRATLDEFLRFARPSRLTRSRVDLALLCAQVAEEVSLDERVGRLEVELEGHLPAIQADDTALRQALLNLFRNAAESARGRPVKLRVGGRPDRTAGTVSIELTDDGEGIPPEDLDRVFLPFFTTKERGGGLGLAIAQKAIVDHDGTISVRSRPGEGSTFTIVLPLG